MARLPNRLWPALMAALAWAQPARATPGAGDCDSPYGGVGTATLDGEVSGISGTAARQEALGLPHAPQFVQAGTDDQPVSTVWNREASVQSEGRFGVAPTVAWTQDEQRQFGQLAAQVPPCVQALANVQQVFRVQRTASGAVTGIPAAAYGLDNSVMFHPRIRLMMANTLFDGALYGGALDANGQYQAVTGYTSCYPPDHGLDASNVAGALAEAPPEIRRLTAAQAVYHEYLHGVVVMLRDQDRLNPLSVDAFLAVGGPSRWPALHEKLYGETPEAETLARYDAQLRAVPNDLTHRAERCAIWLRRAEFLKSQGVPARWPGDSHAIDDEEEYLTILLEQAVYHPDLVFGPRSPYSQAEQAWVKGFWQETFGAPVGGCGSPSGVAVQ